MTSRLISTVLLTTMLGACGAIVDLDDDPRGRNTTTHNITYSQSPSDSSWRARREEPKPKNLKVAGFVLNAFEVRVDGETYSDLEDFYTKELGRLSERVKAAGFDESWSVSFKADIGFQDLWEDMTVYIATTEDRGFQGRTFVDAKGGFQAEFPAEAKDNNFRIRALKRLHIELAKEGERRLICYNFSAMEKSVPFADSEKPVVLSDFSTQITAYDCQFDTNSGLTIPVNRRPAP